MSKLNEVSNLPLVLLVGSPIVPLKVGHKSNAVILDVTINQVTVVTDFGNTIIFSHKELHEEYGEPIWASEHRLFYGTNHDPLNGLRDRFRTQINLLYDLLAKLDD